MSAKEYLMQIRRLSDLIASNKRRIEELELNIGGIRAIDYYGDKVQASPNDVMADSIARLVDLQQDVIAQTVDLQNKKDAMMSKIRRLDDLRYVNLLTYRYIDCLRWEQIAVNMNETMRHIFRIHGKALAEFERANSDALKMS